MKKDSNAYVCWQYSDIMKLFLEFSCHVTES